MITLNLTKNEFTCIFNRCLVPNRNFAEGFRNGMTADDYSVPMSLWDKLEKLSDKFAKEKSK